MEQGSLFDAPTPIEPVGYDNWADYVLETFLLEVTTNGCPYYSRDMCIDIRCRMVGGDDFAYCEAALKQWENKLMEDITTT